MFDIWRGWQDILYGSHGSNRPNKYYWLISCRSFSSASVARGMYKQSWPSECLLVLINSWSLNSVKWEFSVIWLLTRKRSRQILYKLLTGIPEEKCNKIWGIWDRKIMLWSMCSYLPSSSGCASWCSARTLNTLWALGVKLWRTIAAVLALWAVPPWARIKG